jgi:chaperone modulatory protein CbpM
MTTRVFNGVLLDEEIVFTLADLSRACTGRSEWIVQLVDEGILEPRGNEQKSWRFSSSSLTRARKAMRLQHDLQVNLAGAALALELMEQIDSLRARLKHFE